MSSKNGFSLTKTMLFVAALAITSQADAGLISPNIGLPLPGLAWSRLAFNLGVENPDMNDNNADGRPDAWVTSGFQVGNNPPGRGITTFDQGGTLEQRIASPDPNGNPPPPPPPLLDWWVEITYRTVPANVQLELAISYEDSPGSIRQDFFFVPGANPGATRDFWGSFVGTPTNVVFQIYGPGVADTAAEVDFLDFRVRYNPIPPNPAPEPSTFALVAIGIALIFVSRLRKAASTSPRFQ